MIVQESLKCPLWIYFLFITFTLRFDGKFSSINTTSERPKKNAVFPWSTMEAHECTKPIMNCSAWQHPVGWFIHFCYTVWSCDWLFLSNCAVLSWKAAQFTQHKSVYQYFEFSIIHAFHSDVFKIPIQLLLGKYIHIEASWYIYAYAYLTNMDQQQTPKSQQIKNRIQ